MVASAREREELRRRELEVSRLLTKQAKQKHAAATKKVQTLESKKLEKEAEREKLRSRTEIYQNDTELDPILSVLKLGFTKILGDRSRQCST